MTDEKLEQVQRPKQLNFMTILLAVIFVSFCGILIGAYVITKKINPVMLDQNGKPINAPAAQTDTGKH
jgi:hypothetical protein